MRQIDNLKDKIRTAYERGEGTFKQLADKYNVKVGTIKSWSKRDKDDGNQWIKVATKIKNKKVATKSNKKAESIGKNEAEIDFKNDDLSDKQRLFCLYYIKCFNVAKAAIKAGYSRNYAYTGAYNMIEKVSIQEEIQRLKAKKFKGIFLEPSDILQRYIDIAFADVTDYADFGNAEYKVKNKEGKEEKRKYSFVNFKNSNEVDGTIISEIKQGKDGISLKLESKKWALDFLAKNIGLLDIPTKEKLNIEKRKMELAEKQADDLDDDIEYICVNDEDDEK